MQITDALERRQVEYVSRDEDGGVTLVCQDGREVSLFVDSKGSIQLRGVGVKIVLPPLSFASEQGLT